MANNMDVIDTSSGDDANDTFTDDEDIMSEDETLTLSQLMMMVTCAVLKVAVPMMTCALVVAIVTAVPMMT
jgi:hypothetical protein